MSDTESRTPEHPAAAPSATSFGSATSGTQRDDGRGAAIRRRMVEVQTGPNSSLGGGCFSSQLASCAHVVEPPFRLSEPPNPLQLPYSPPNRFFLRPTAPGMGPGSTEGLRAFWCGAPARGRAPAVGGVEPRAGGAFRAGAVGEQLRF